MTATALKQNLESRSVLETDYRKIVCPKCSAVDHETHARIPTPHKVETFFGGGQVRTCLNMKCKKVTTLSGGR